MQWEKNCLFTWQMIKQLKNPMVFPQVGTRPLSVDQNIIEAFAATQKPHSNKKQQHKTPWQFTASNDPIHDGGDIFFRWHLVHCCFVQCILVLHVYLCPRVFNHRGGYFRPHSHYKGTGMPRRMWFRRNLEFPGAVSQHNDDTVELLTPVGREH